MRVSEDKTEKVRRPSTETRAEKHERVCIRESLRIEDRD